MTGLGPFAEIRRIQNEINRLFDNLGDLGERGGGAWIPNVDILETEDCLLVKVELPGVPIEDLSLSVLAGNVIIRGRKPQPQVPGAAEFHVSEQEHGEFKRVIQLGVPVNTRQARAVLNNGLLRIRFPKVPNRRGEEVPIEVQSR